MRASLVATVLAGLGAAPCAQANIVFNGGFETGNFAGWSSPPIVFPPSPNPSLCYVDSSGDAHSGEYYAQLSSTQFEYISQTLPTTAGMDYELTFWLRRSDLPPGSFVVRWEGQQVFVETLFGTEGLSWQPHTVSLTAQTSGSLLQFGQHYFPGEFHLDDVSVVQVPAPSASVLLGIGGLAALRRSRRG